MGKRKAGQLLLITGLSKKHKKHLKDFGEQHPFYDRVSRKERIQVCELSENSEHSSLESEEENDVEQMSTYQKLLVTLKASPYSDSKKEEDDDLEEEEEEESDKEEEEEEEEKEEESDKEEEEEEGNDQEEEEEESDKDHLEMDKDDLQSEGETEGEDASVDVPDQEQDKETSVHENRLDETGGADSASDAEHEATGEFTDVMHESEFSLETIFVEEESGDPVGGGENGRSSAEVLKDPFKHHLDEELDEKVIDKILARSKSVSQVKTTTAASLSFGDGSHMIIDQTDKATTILELMKFCSCGSMKGWKTALEPIWPVLGQLVFSSTLEKFGTIKPEKEVDLKQLHLHRPLESTWPKVNSPFLASQVKSKDQPFTPLQRELFCIINSYKDVFYSERTALRNGEEVRQVYCLHALNHVLKANAQVLGNNAKRRDQKPGPNDDFRDQGLTRPKVLIVVPFRESALRVVHIFISLLESASQKKIDVSNKKRFKGEFGSDPEERPPNLRRPEDYEAVFAGNIDDHFRIGVAVLQRSMRLYAPFYSSDIIIASPLGLRTVIGAEGEKKREYDFLSSIEILIIDEADIYLMQNWEHVLHLMNHMNLLPLEAHGVDFSRVRMHSLNNWSKYYRQTLLFSALQEPQINSIFNKHCFNYRGQAAVRNVALTGSISHVVVQLPHVFRKLEAEDAISIIDARFNFFIDKVLPEYRDAIMSHTLIYVPSYFDYVRLRNYFKKEGLSFMHICEYTNKSGISRARQFFLKGKKQFLIFTERFHFYKRYSVRGIRNLIFYELPTYAHFYSEVCNMMKLAGDGEEATLTCTVLYSKYEAQKVAAVVGVERAAQMLQSSKNVHLFVTGETQ